MRGLATVLISCVVAIGVCDSAPPSDDRAESPPEAYPLLPLSRLLAPESVTAPQISPDGRRLSWIAPLDGVANFFVAPVDNLEAAEPLTRRTGRGIQAADVSGNVMYRWHARSTHLIFPEDYDGDERWDVHIVAVDSGQERNLTPMPDAKVSITAYSARFPDAMLVNIVGPDPEESAQEDNEQTGSGLFRLDLVTGERQLVMQNQGLAAIVADNNLTPRLALRLNADAEFDVLRRDDVGDWNLFWTIERDDLPALSASGDQKIVRISGDDRRVLMYEAKGRNTSALVSIDLNSGERNVIAEDDRVDVGGVLYRPGDNAVLAYATNWTRNTWNAVEAPIQQDIDYLGSVADGDWKVVSQSAANDVWIVRYMLSHQPTTFYLYDRTARTARKLFTAAPELEGLKLSKLHPYVIKSSDGYDLVSYLMLPPWLDEDEDGRPPQPVPTVVLVHGGPSDERASFAFGAFLHWLANRGYAVLYVNFRGSPGFGKSFVNAQNMEWGGMMHDDVVVQVKWAIENGISDPQRMAIVGGSYGGYEALVGMTMTPDVFACGIDLVGPSNLEVFMPHWNVDTMSRVIGDPRTPQGLEFLRSRSPINFAHQTKHPILIGQGANDSRVPQSQSDSVVEKMRQAGAKVTYLLYPDEGHGLYRTENNFSFWAIVDVFLAQHLGGRHQPIADQLQGSSVRVPAGAEFIPGLTEALKRREDE